MKIDKEKGIVTFDNPNEIYMLTQSLRHCHKQNVWDNASEYGSNWADMCYEFSDRLYDAFYEKARDRA